MPFEIIKDKYSGITNIIYYPNIIQAIKQKYTDECEVVWRMKAKTIIQNVLKKPGDKMFVKRLYKYLVSSKGDSNEVAKNGVILLP